MDKFVLLNVQTSTITELNSLRQDLNNQTHFFECGGICLTPDQYWNYYYTLTKNDLHQIWMCADNATFINLKYC